jgi:hypothetical protein
LGVKSAGLDLSSDYFGGNIEQRRRLAQGDESRVDVALRAMSLDGSGAPPDSEGFLDIEIDLSDAFCGHPCLRSINFGLLERSLMLTCAQHRGSSPETL